MEQPTELERLIATLIGRLDSLDAVVKSQQTIIARLVTVAEAHDAVLQTVNKRAQREMEELRRMFNQGGDAKVN